MSVLLWIMWASLIASILAAIAALYLQHREDKKRGPWIPTAKEVEQLRKDLDVALSSDFRIMEQKEQKRCGENGYSCCCCRGCIPD